MDNLKGKIQAAVRKANSARVGSLEKRSMKAKEKARNTPFGSQGVANKQYKKSTKLANKATKLEMRQMGRDIKNDQNANKGRSVTRSKGTASYTVDGKDQQVMQKSKTVSKNGLTKRTVVKTRGIGDSVIKRSKDVTTYKDPSKSRFPRRGNEISSYEVDGKNYNTLGSSKVVKGKGGLTKKVKIVDYGVGANNPIDKVKSVTKYKQGSRKNPVTQKTLAKKSTIVSVKNPQ